MEYFGILKIIGLFFSCYIIYITFTKNKELRLALDNKSLIKEDNKIDKKLVKMGIRINMVIATIGVYYIFMFFASLIGIR